MLKKPSVAFSATSPEKVDSQVPHIFNGIQPSKMAARPVPRHRLPKNGVFFSSLLVRVFRGSQSCANEDFESVQTEASHVEGATADVPQDDDSDPSSQMDVRGGTITGHPPTMAVEYQVVTTAQLEADAVAGLEVAVG